MRAIRLREDVIRVKRADAIPRIRRSGHAADAGTARASLGDLGRWDGGSRNAAVLALQRSVGNHAVASSLATISSASAARPGLGVGAPKSMPANPPAGVSQIRDEQQGGSHAAGYTSLPAPTPPDLVIDEPQHRSDGWAASVRPTSVGSDPAVSLYPAPGVHDLGPGEGGQQRHIDVTSTASDLIRQGEEEHLLDIELARQLSYDRAATAVNAAAASAPTTAADAGTARRQARKEVQDALPEPLRAAEGGDPVKPWIRAYSQLMHVTIERDEHGWHDMSSGTIHDPAEKKRLGVPEEDELKRYARAPGIGKHPSAELMNARFNELSSG